MTGPLQGCSGCGSPEYDPCPDCGARTCVSCQVACDDCDRFWCAGCGPRHFGDSDRQGRCNYCAQRECEQCLAVGTRMEKRDTSKGFVWLEICDACGHVDDPRTEVEPPEPQIDEARALLASPWGT